VDATDPNSVFVSEFANPHMWLLTADNLHEQATLLYSRRGRGMLSRRRINGGTKNWDATDKPVFLLGGFALENAIKAFLVHENPNWVSNGRLSSHLRTHSLTKLEAMAKNIPRPRGRFGVLKGFESGLDSWARYPCGLSYDQTADAESLAPELWRGYLRVMRTYGIRLRDLLSKKAWQGPHGFSGRWTFEGEFL
jgi:hypothetical protein